MANKKIKPQIRSAANPIEVGRSIAGGVKKSVVEDLGKGGIDEAFRELLGNALGLSSSGKEASQAEAKSEAKGGPIEVFNAANHKGEGAPKKKESHQEAAMNHGAEVKKIGEKSVKKEQHKNEQTVDQLLQELTQIQKSADSGLRTKYAPNTLNKPKNVGTYHEGFFKGLIKSFNDAKKSSESNAWIGKMKGKGKKGFDSSVANGQAHQSGERTTIMNSAG